MRKPRIYISQNKVADQLCSNCTADQCLCFRCTDSRLRLLLKSEISSFLSASVTVQAGLCLTWSETQIVGVLTHRLYYFQILAVLAAITEVIKTEGGTETETEYFAALVGVIFQCAL